MFDVEIDDRDQALDPDPVEPEPWLSNGEWDSIPAGLDAMAPGVFLAAVLSSLDRSRLSGHDLVVVLRAEARMASHFQALSYESMVGVSNRTHEELGDDPEVIEVASDEIRAALALTRRSADIEMSFALALRTEHPRVWEALASGEIDLRRARTIIEGLSGLSGGEADQVIGQVMKVAGSSTTGELRALIRRLAVEANPDSARTRYEQSVEDRRMFSEVNPAGSVNLMGLDLPLAGATAARNRINQIARSLKTSTEIRTLDQIRADVFLDLLCGTNSQDQHPAGTVNIHVELATLAGLDERAGEIPGVGPVISDIARQVAYQQHHGTWTYTVTDQGRPIATGTTRRRPTTSLKRQIQASHPVCVFPGCRMPATECDIDHHHRWEHDGQTTLANLGPVCRHDHQLLDHHWTLTRQPNGDHTWTSPLGHTYTKPVKPP